MRSDATNVADYLDEIAETQRDLVVTLRDLVKANLPSGYQETMNWGMISYEVPLDVSGKTYNGKPLMYAAIGAQKRHVGLYLCGLYCRTDLMESFKQAHRASGKKLDIGKACLRIKKPEDILPEAISAAVAALSVEEYVAISKR